MMSTSLLINVKTDTRFLFFVAETKSKHNKRLLVAKPHHTINTHTSALVVVV